MDYRNHPAPMAEALLQATKLGKDAGQRPRNITLGRWLLPPVLPTPCGGLATGPAYVSLWVPARSRDVSDPRQPQDPANTPLAEGWIPTELGSTEPVSTCSLRFRRS